MSGTDDKGKFSADISQKVIDEALRSVEAVRAPEIEVPTEETAVPGLETTDPGTEANQSLLQAELKASQALGRETMGRLKEMHERMLRATADLENYRHRAQKEKEETLKFGNEKVIRDFLPIIDNLERAIEHANSPADFDSVKQGIVMTRKLFEDTLGKHGVARLASLGQPFDPRFHEAMQSTDRQDIPPNQVVSEIVGGYLLKDRLLRPALVVVSKRPDSAASADSAPSASAEEAAKPTPQPQSGPRGDA